MNTKYNVITGSIVGYFAGSSQSLGANINDNEAFVAGRIAAHNYIINGVVKEREVLEVVADTPVAEINLPIRVTVPVGAWYSMNSEAPVQATTATIELTRDVPGKMIVELVGQYLGSVTLRWVELAAQKDKAKDALDAQAESARSRVVTPGSGQAMTYLRKADAARAYLSGQALSDAQKLRLDDEAARLDVTVEEAAQILVTTADAWEGIDAQIDNIRLMRKALVKVAITAGEIADIVSETVWPV